MFTIKEHLCDIYPNIPKTLENDYNHIPRYDNLTKRFEKFYGKQPALFVRAPAKAILFGI